MNLPLLLLLTLGCALWGGDCEQEALEKILPHCSIKHTAVLQDLCEGGEVELTSALVSDYLPLKRWKMLGYNEWQQGIAFQGQDWDMMQLTLADQKTNTFIKNHRVFTQRTDKILTKSMCCLTCNEEKYEPPSLESSGRLLFSFKAFMSVGEPKISCRHHKLVLTAIPQSRRSIVAALFFITLQNIVIIQHTLFMPLSCHSLHSQ